jgi:hypothetical protein
VFLVVQRGLPIRLGPGSLSAPLAAALVDRLGAPLEPARPTPSDGVLVLDGWGEVGSESIQIEATSGSIRRRIDYPDRIVLSVEEGTSITPSRDARLWRFVNTESKSSQRTRSLSGAKPQRGS